MNMPKPQKRLMRRLRWIFGFGAGAYLIALVMLNFLQEKLIFLPTKLPQEYTYSFSAPFEELFLSTPDGAKLNALWFKKQESRGLILYFHGNAGNLSRWGTIVQPLVWKGYDVLIMDYRTYGKSTGTLSEEALYADAQLFYDFGQRHYQEEEIILYGRSLGTGMATRLAAENNPSLLLLETPYYSLLDLGARRFPWLPVGWFMKYPFRSYQAVQKVKCPIRIFHGTEDRVVPFDSGQKLYRSIPGDDKEFFAIQGGGHNNLASFPDFQQAVNAVLD